jgi:NitT/TauT family transport system ATP-binding protein
MKIIVSDLSFGYGSKLLYKNFNAEFSNDVDNDSVNRPLVILGPSGCGKTTLIKLLGGLLKPDAGRIIYLEDNNNHGNKPPRSAFIFQEPRLLPWLTAIDNVSLPLKKDFEKDEALKRAAYFLSLVFPEEAELHSCINSFPNELSGGQAQRVSMARAFAWPSPVLFMDEPFQSLDAPLRIKLMDSALSLAKQDAKLIIAITHDPREAIYMAGRIIILGKIGQGIVYDKNIILSSEDRSYGCAMAEELEEEMRRVLKN